MASTDGKGKPRGVTRMTTTVYDADPAWSPNGDQIAFRRHDRTRNRRNSDVYVIDANGKSEAKPLADDPHADEQNRSWSPSGEEIAYKATLSLRQGRDRRSISLDSQPILEFG